MRADINEKKIFQEETNETSEGNNLSYDQMKERVIGLWTAVCSITDRVQFTASSGRHSVLERPLSEAKRPLIFN